MQEEETQGTTEELASLIWYGSFSCWKSVEDSIPDTPEQNTRRFFLLYDFLHVLLYFCRLVACEVAGQERGTKLADQIDAFVLQNLLLEFARGIDDDRKVIEEDFVQGLARSRQSYALCTHTIDSFDDLFLLFGKHASVDAGLSDQPSFAYRAQMLAMSVVPTLDLHHRLAELIR